MVLPDANCGAPPDGDPNHGLEQQTIGEFKTCYYCGKKMPADAPRCETCGNDRSFTWTKKIRED